MDPITIALGIARLVPMVTGWIAGDDAEEKAQGVVDMAMDVTGAVTGRAALTALQGNPDMVLALEDKVTERIKLHLEDRSNARGRDVAYVEAGRYNWRGDVLAIAAIVGLIGLIWTLLFVSIPDGPARDILLILSGALVAIVKDVYGFEFGSSRGSKEKDALLGQ
mgnify:CR=1 FL=1